VRETNSRAGRAARDGDRFAALVRARLSDGREIEVRAAELDPSDRGVALRELFLPWHRILEYRTRVRRPLEALADDRRSRILIRLVVDDRGDGEQTFTLPASRFESDAWCVTILVEGDAEPGGVTAERVTFPWHRVVEYERIARIEKVPTRPDRT